MLRSFRKTTTIVRDGRLRYFSSAKSSSKGPVSWTSLGLVGIVGGSLLLYYRTEKERLQTQSSNVSKVKSVGKPLLGGPWTLVDCETRKPVTDASFYGSYHLLYFGFTRCPDICPNELVRIGQVVDTLEKQHQLKLNPLFITVDPKRDTIQQLRAYKKDFHPSFRMLTGTPEQISQATKAYRVYFNKASTTEEEDQQDDDDYLIDHSIVMYLVDGHGEFVDFFTQSAQVNDIVKRIANVLTV